MGLRNKHRKVAAKPPSVKAQGGKNEIDNTGVNKKEDVVVVGASQTVVLPSAADQTEVMSSGRRVRFVLSMIVGNEEKVIRRCLANIAPLIKATDGAIVISCNGWDGTRAIIDKLLIDNDIMGTTIFRPWIKDFGHSRTEALKVAEDFIFQYQRAKTQQIEFKPTCVDEFDTVGVRLASHRLNELEDIWYALFMDADNLLLPAGMDNKQWLALPENERVYPIPDLVSISQCPLDRYYIDTWRKEVTETYETTLLVRINPSNRFAWEDPLHEYLVSSRSSSKTLSGCTLNSGCDGDRNQSPTKFLDDFTVFQRLLLKGDTPRWWYYAGQSLRDFIVCNELDTMLDNYVELAITCFENAMKKSNFLEERYRSCFHCATLVKWYGGIEQRKRAFNYFLKCLEYMAERREALWHIMDLAKLLDMENVAWPLCKLGWKRPRRHYVLNVDEHIWSLAFPRDAAALALKWDDKESYVELMTEAINSPLIDADEKMDLKRQLESHM